MEGEKGDGSRGSVCEMRGRRGEKCRVLAIITGWPPEWKQQLVHRRESRQTKKRRRRYGRCTCVPATALSSGFFFVSPLLLRR